MAKTSKKDIVQFIAENYPEYYDECKDLEADSLNTRLAQNGKEWEQVREAEEADEKLEAARAEANEFAAPYRDAKKLLKAKRQFLVKLLKDGGA